MIGHSTCGRRGFFQPPQTGRGFSRIENPATCPFDLSGERMRQRRHAREPLQKIQSHPFAFEQPPGAPFNGCNTVTLAELLAIPAQESQPFRVNSLQNGGSSQHQRFTRQKIRGSLSTLRYANPRRDISGSDIFGQCPPDNFNYFGVQMSRPMQAGFDLRQLRLILPQLCPDRLDHLLGRLAQEYAIAQLAL